MNAAPIRWLPVHRRYPGLYAGFWRRVFAWTLDAVILGALLVIAGALLVASWRASAGAPGAWRGWYFGVASLRLAAIALVAGWLYYALCEASRWQATPGKLALGLAVTDEAGRRIGFGRATGRFFGKLLSGLILGVGFLLAGWTERRQALHDQIAGCCVVRRAGLRDWRQTPDVVEPAPAASALGMPAWAVALVVLACMVLALPGIAVLGVLGFPIYRNHAVRVEIAQGLEASARARALIAEYIGERGRLPVDNDALGLPTPDAIGARYVTSVRVAGGKVVVTYGNHASRWIRGRHVVMSPIGEATMLHWQCTSPDINARYLPRACRP